MKKEKNPCQTRPKTGAKKSGERKTLERRVELGAEKAIKDYGEVFKRLAAYDRA